MIYPAFSVASSERAHRHPRKVYYKASEGGYGEYSYNHCLVVKNDKFIKSRMYSRAMNDEIMVGEAYCFFHCDATSKEVYNIAGGISDSFEKEESKEQVVLGSLKTIHPLKLSLSEGSNNRDYGDDKELTTLAKEAYSDRELTYVLSATYLGKTNEETADVLADILDQFYLSDIYKEGDGFFGEIVHKNEKGKYVFAD